VHPYFGAIQLEDEVRVTVGYQRCLVEPGRRVNHREDAQPGVDPNQVPEGTFEACQVRKGDAAR
jgi:hypothetical protein